MWKVKGECSQNKDEGRRSFVSLVIVITFCFSFFFCPLVQPESAAWTVLKCQLPANVIRQGSSEDSL